MNERQRKAHDFLCGYRIRVDALKQAERDYQAANSMAHSMIAKYGDGSGGGSYSKDKMADAATAMVDHADAIHEAMGVMTEEYRKRLHVILGVGDIDPILGGVLRMIYMEGWQPSEIKAINGRAYSRSSVYRIIEEALDAASGLMSKG